MADEHTMIAFIQNIGPWELIVVAIIALLIFGRRLPEVGRSLGKGIVEFKKGLKDTEESIRDVDPSKQDEPKPKPESSTKSS